MHVRRARGAARVWLFLFPATYALHALEELFAAGGFNNWIARFSGAPMPREVFIELNVTFWLVMTALIIIAFLSSTFAPVTALAALILLNAMLHTVTSIITASYSPGLITAIVLWLPLSLYALQRTRRMLPAASFWVAVAIGVLFQAGLAWIVLSGAFAA